MADVDKSSLPPPETPFSLNEVEVVPSALRVEWAGTSRKLEPKAMRVLLVLARAAGKVVSRQQLEDEVWSGRVVTEDALTNAVAKLRKALDDNPREPSFIETIAKRGYRLIPRPVYAEPVKPADSLPSAAQRPLSRAWKRASWLLLACAIALLGWLGRSALVALNEGDAVSSRDAAIAVLPMEDLGGETSQQTYFVDGITHDLITELSRQPGLLVIAPSTVYAYRNSDVDDRAIAQQLGVRYLIRGGVQRQGERLRVNVRLLEAETGSTLWAERFTGSASDLFRIQDKVVAGIARGLRLRFDDGEPSQDHAATTASLAAYDEFLRGRERYGRLTPSDNSMAIAHFERAVELDPRFARAYAGLALAWSRQAIDGWTADPAASLAKAAQNAEKAAAIDPDVPQIHFVRGQVALFQGRHEEAAAAALTATRLDRNYADAYGLLAWILHYGGRPDKASEALAEARLRNPASSASYDEISGEINFVSGRYEEAVSAFASALSRNPTHTRARLWLAASLVQAGRHEDAAWEAEELQATNPDFALNRMLFAFPLKDPERLEILRHTLRRLGFPN